MVGDPYFVKVVVPAGDEETGACRAAPFGIVDDLDAWLAGASHAEYPGASAGEAEPARELTGAAALPPHSQPVHPGRRRRSALRGGEVMRGRDRTGRPERGQARRSRPFALAALVVGSLLLAAIVLLPAGSSVPDDTARRGSTSSSPTARPERPRAEQQWRERARTKRAARTLSRRQSAARDRRAAARRADRRRAVAHDRAIRARKQPPKPAVPVVAASTARPDRRVPAVRPRESPPATAEFEP